MVYVTKQTAQLAAILAVILALSATPNHARSADTPATTAVNAAYDQAVQKGIDFLRTAGQNADGSFGTGGVEPGITAIVLAGVLRNGRGPDDPFVAKSLKYLEGFIQPDGGIYDPKSRQKNYECCLGLVCLQLANKDGRYDKAIKNADTYLKGLQFKEGDQRPISDVSYGGVGYAGSERPDLSNTQFLMDALQAAGNGPNDEAVKKALVFISRCQNLETEYNTTPFAAKIQDGGFYYSPNGQGNSMAGKTDDGGLRSYGSMTYAGLKSMVFAGLMADDPRVKAAVEWARKHYSVNENPGLGKAGLFYYYILFAKALDALGQDQFVDGEGKTHNWRADLITELATRQQPNGSWVNSDNRWMEGDAKLVTGYALLALSYCRPSAGK